MPHTLGLPAQQRPHRFERVEPTEVHRSHPTFPAGRSRPRQRSQVLTFERVVDGRHVGHAAGRLGSALALLGCPRGVDADVGDRASPGVLVPVERLGRPEREALIEQSCDPPADFLGGPLDGRFTEPDVGHLLEQFGPLLETVADGPRQGGQLLDSLAVSAFAQAGLLVEGNTAVSAMAAVVIGPPVFERAEEAQQSATSIGMVGSGVVAVWTGYRAALVADFFWAR